MTAKSIDFVELDLTRVDELVAMWRQSFEAAVGVVDPHPMHEQREYLLSTVVPNNEICVAILDSRIVGFVAATDESVAQLYVHIDFQRRGIGTKLLNWAKGRSAGSLWLYTFERNLRAQAFYERHGFEVIERGFRAGVAAQRHKVLLVYRRRRPTLTFV